jgi:3',5'-cyclic AMP phosphodiesterase CpdA
MSDRGVVRLAHFSDLHLTTSPLGWRPRDWLSKRVTGWLNARLLPRFFHFRHAEMAARALVEDLRGADLDHAIFSGDASTLGFEAEFRHAARILPVSTMRGLAVPGNHDYYTPEAEQSGGFERTFASWQSGIRVDLAPYPFAQHVGDVWLIGLNSSRGHRLPLDATGYVDRAQLERLVKLANGLDEGPRLLVTHYPLFRECGQRDSGHHGLANLDEVLEAARAAHISAWLHGHRHKAYCLTGPLPFPVICAGSATDSGCWRYHQYEVEGRDLRLRRRVYRPASGRFETDSEQALLLPFGLKAS